MWKKKRGKIQAKVLTVLRELKEKERRDWIPTFELVVKIYHPENLGKEIIIEGERKREFDWSYSPGELTSTHRAITALERRGLIESKVIKLKDVMERERKFGGVQVRRMVKLVHESS